MTFTTLTSNQLDNKLAFIEQYIQAANPAEGSKLDANANVTMKTITSLEAELHKDINIQINRRLMTDELRTNFGEDVATQYLKDIEDHLIYVHDESSIKPYCASITMYPFLLNGLTGLGGYSQAPKHLDSFCGAYINLVYALSSQIAGALATVEFLLYFDYFARLDFGDDYLTTHRHVVDSKLQQVVYTVNEPAGARGYQSVFLNWSVYDQPYFDAMFGHFTFPDMTPPNFDTFNELQKYFLTWFNAERAKKVLTFPVVTVAMLTENGKPKDHAMADFCAKELSEGNSFFVYMSDNADSLSSCCRLRNEIVDNTFSYTLGAGGVSTGSLNVITLNINRLVQQKQDIAKLMERVYQYQVSYRRIVERFNAAGLLPIYSQGFMDIKKQYLTIGLNGLVEAAEFLGMEISNNPEYVNFLQETLNILFEGNKKAKAQYGYLFNTELVPAENLGVKNAIWDKKDGLQAPRECYNSYFYKVEDDDITVIDKFLLHGQEILQYLDGGSALHLNLDNNIGHQGFLRLFDLAAKTGCQYWCTNIKMTICNECNHIDKRSMDHCSSCGSEDVDHATRIIGYLKRISNFSKARQREAGLRIYHSQTPPQS